MALIEWNDNLSVKVPMIDHQHQELIRLLNQLHEAMKTGQSRQAVGEVLTRLIKYTKAHFDTEESMMARRKYPALAAHRQVHQALTAKVLDFQAQYAAGAMSVDVTLLPFLKKWIVEHIQKEDQKYSSCLSGILTA